MSQPLDLSTWWTSTLVARYGPRNRTQYDVLQAVVSFDQDDGTGQRRRRFDPTIGQVAERARMGERGTSKTLDVLEAAGWLTIARARGRNTNLYRVNRDRLERAARAHLNPAPDAGFDQEPTMHPVQGSEAPTLHATTSNPARGADTESCTEFSTPPGPVDNRADPHGSGTTGEGHPWEEKTRARLTRLRDETGLDLDVDEMLDWAYELRRPDPRDGRNGPPNPWYGALVIVQEVEQRAMPENTRDPRAVIRARLVKLGLPTKPNPGAHQRPLWPAAATTPAAELADELHAADPAPLNDADLTAAYAGPGIVDLNRRRRIG